MVFAKMWLEVTSRVSKGISGSVAMLDRCSYLKRNGPRDARQLLTLTSGFALSLMLLSACASTPRQTGSLPPGIKSEMPSVSMKEPVRLRLKAEAKGTETVEYFHVSASRAFEAQELRHEKTETLKFTALAETTKVEPSAEGGDQRFTQAITILKKDGTLGLHDFAMPELGERLELVTDSLGKILKAGEWPTNSIFYVSPVSLPEGPVEVGDTWAMQATWLSLQDMVPYELDMISILKGFVKCGDDTCADIEVNGNVAMQGALQQALVFRSEWRGRLLFALNAGTVAWSRVNSEELFAYDKVYRTVGSCLEAALREPGRTSVVPAGVAPTCEGFQAPTARRAP